MKGISTNEQQVAVWINSHPICSHLSKIVEEMYTSEETAENSEEEDGKAKQSRRKHEEEGERDAESWINGIGLKSWRSFRNTLIP